jgi:hypothetical protein
MTTPMLQKLQEYLDSVSPEQFAADWAEVKAMNFTGPTAIDFIATFRHPKIDFFNVEAPSILSKNEDTAEFDVLDQQFTLAA